ncbi:MAG TPA: arginine deiminase-related protein [Terriglobales bacterium]|nr:arginine deiminase-related protein [Terriglobales bacterium]
MASQTVLLCPPTYFEVRDRKNPYMRAPIDRAKAHEQWKAVCDVYQKAGLHVALIPAVKDLEDMVFAANQVFVGIDEKLGKFIVPSEMRYPSRQREVPYYVDWFADRGYKVIGLDLRGEFLEGHGDLLWHPGRKHVWAGYGFRSSIGGVKRFASAMKEFRVSVTPLRLTDEHFYHLDTCLSPLSADAAILYPGAFSAEALDCLRRDWPRLHELTRDQALKLTCNGVVAGNSYITSHVSDGFKRILESEGLCPVVVDISEFEKSGGGVFCMKNFI